MARRILVVEDEADIRAVARASLELTRGWTVLEAESGPRGLDVARAERPDAIVLDVMMPDMDGPETFRRLRADEATRDIPVVLMTARAHQEDRDSLLALGVEGVLAKPFDPMTLADQLSALLGWSEP